MTYRYNIIPAASSITNMRSLAFFACIVLVGLFADVGAFTTSSTLNHRMMPKVDRYQGVSQKPSRSPMGPTVRFPSKSQEVKALHVSAVSSLRQLEGFLRFFYLQWYLLPLEFFEILLTLLVWVSGNCCLGKELGYVLICLLQAFHLRI